jgi:hypothetical protein
MRRSTAVCGLTAAFLGLGASPALAGGTGSEAGWVPIEQLQPDYYQPFDVPACGSTVTIAAGSVREVQERERTRPDGTVVRDYRGAATLDLVRQSDGAVIDELDIGGPSREVAAPDGSSVHVVLHGASLTYPVPGAEDDFTAAGLPDLGWFTHGVVTFTIASDPGTGDITGATIGVHARVTDLCRWFDRREHAHS